MDKKAPRVNLKQLIRKTSASSGYYLYEVEDVVGHFIAHIQRELKTSGKVRIDGIGTIKRTELKLKNFSELSSDDKDVMYNAFKLSISMDEAMRNNLKLQE